MSLGNLSFIFYFMPGFFILYYIIPSAPSKAKGYLLAVGSLFFYAWGNLTGACVLIVLSFLVWAIPGPRAGRALRCCFGVAFCAAILAVFKYIDTPLGLPLGASFYIFHMISYLIDVKRGFEPEKDPLSFIAYTAMFPKLIMGPIVQYNELAGALTHPDISIDRAADGLFRFVVGFSKKTLIAMQLAPITESLRADAPASAAAAWLGAICYSMQLYFDFSSYSDMAIGLGRMAGFDFGENFVYPYTSASVSEFYRRWHASLGRWFRDYLYIPLGGSRKGPVRSLAAIMIVWTAAGIWHGSTLNFLIWGLGLGVIICFEKLTGIARARRTIFGWLWTCVLIVISWVVFSSPDMPSAVDYIGMMFGGSPFVLDPAVLTALHDRWYILAAAAFGCSPLLRDSCAELFRGRNSIAAYIVKTAVMCALLGLSLIVIVNSGYSAFIYTKF